MLHLNGIVVTQIQHIFFKAHVHVLSQIQCSGENGYLVLYNWQRNDTKEEHRTLANYYFNVFITNQT